MENKEKIYDEKISPLIKQIIEICKDESIPMFCEFQFSKDGFCRSFLKSTDTNIFEHYLALSHCKSGGSVNIDSILIWLLKNYNCSASMFLYKHEKEKERAVLQQATSTKGGSQDSPALPNVR
jgi:hypothetical protein